MVLICSFQVASSQACVSADFQPALQPTQQVELDFKLYRFYVFSTVLDPKKSKYHDWNKVEECRGHNTHQDGLTVAQQLEKPSFLLRKNSC